MMPVLARTILFSEKMNVGGRNRWCRELEVWADYPVQGLSSDLGPGPRGQSLHLCENGGGSHSMNSWKTVVRIEGV